MDLKFKISDFSADEQVIYSRFSTKTGGNMLLSIIVLFSALITILIDGFLIGASVVSSLINKTSLDGAIYIMLAMLMHILPFLLLGFYLFRKNQKEKNKYFLITKTKIFVILNTENPNVTIYYIDQLKSIIYKSEKIILVKNDDRIVLDGISLNQEMISTLDSQIR